MVRKLSKVAESGYHGSGGRGAQFRKLVLILPIVIKSKWSSVVLPKETER